MKKNNPYIESTTKIDKSSTNFREDLTLLRPFSADGRLGRLRYFVYSMVLLIIAVLLIFLFLFISPKLGQYLLIPIALALIIPSIFLTIQRCHDFNMTGWLSILILVPFFIGLPIVQLIFSLIPGSEGDNNYGYQPPPNTTAIKVAAIIIPILFVILCALVILFFLTIFF